MYLALLPSLQASLTLWNCEEGVHLTITCKLIAWSPGSIPKITGQSTVKQRGDLVVGGGSSPCDLNFILYNQW